MEETPFINDQEDNSATKKSTPPVGYIPVKLSSLGRLTAPKIIHVRNYSGEEALKLSTMNADNSLEVLVDALQNLIWEDIDASMLNENEVEEIMLNIYVNWWNTSIDFPYQWEEYELKELEAKRAEQIRTGSEVPKVTVNIANIKTNTIMSEFKEPITIVHRDVKYWFRLSRVKDMMEAKEYVVDKYLAEENRYSKISKDLEYNSSIDPNSPIPFKERPVDPKEKRAYQEYLNKRSIDFERISQMGKVLKIGDKEVKTFEDRITMYKEIPSDIWVKFNQIIKKSIQFGVDPELKVISPLTNKEVTRRFQFRILDFIPTMELPDDSEYTVLFGEQ